ncbi:MAG: hypothetical protein WBN37_13560, partial [Arenicellales bacterium]
GCDYHQVNSSIYIGQALITATPMNLFIFGVDWLEFTSITSLDHVEEDACTDAAFFFAGAKYSYAFR